MGVLAKTLAPATSSAAKKADLWGELMDELSGCLFPSAVDDFEARCLARGLQIPPAYEEPLADAVEARREELKAEDVGAILRDRYDFT